MEVTPEGLVDKITTYDEYLDSDIAVRRRQSLQVQVVEENLEELDGED